MLVRLAEPRPGLAAPRHGLCACLNTPPWLPCLPVRTGRLTGYDQQAPKVQAQAQLGVTSDIIVRGRLRRTTLHPRSATLGRPSCARADLGRTPCRDDLEDHQHMLPSIRCCGLSGRPSAAIEKPYDVTGQTAAAGVGPLLLAGCSRQLALAGGRNAWLGDELRPCRRWLRMWSLTVSPFLPDRPSLSAHRAHQYMSRGSNFRRPSSMGRVAYQGGR